jgi:protein phosphatase
VTTSLVVLVAVIIGGGYIAWRWSQDQYYVGADSKGEVIIYRGVNQRIAGISLSKPYQATGIQLTQVPAPYQQTVKATDAASSLSNAQAIVANVRTQVTACQQQYTKLKDWVTKENAYQVALARAKLATQARKPAPKVPPNPGPQPSKTVAMCPPSAVFGIAASALTPAPGHS